MNWRGPCLRTLSQLESSLLNLCVNARDAMPYGGELAIVTRNRVMDVEDASAYGMAKGQYVSIEVVDSGTGMPVHIAARAFEPFFTTKDVGKGTGLGLSQVYGFAQQSGGTVKLVSTPGKGTSVGLFLPRQLGKTEAHDTNRPFSDAAVANDETILVVEDDDRLRAVSAEALRDLGYKVIEAALPEDALRMFKDDMNISLLFTDVVMPGMSGRDLAEQIQKICPGLKVLYTTGYSRNVLIANGSLEAGIQLLQKPYGLEELALRVRILLDRN